MSAYKTSGYETIRLEQDARGVARLTLNRPESHNALDAAMIKELTAAAAELAADASVRVVVLAGEGKSFCAGGDLGWMREQTREDRAGRMAASSEFAHIFRTLDSLPKPLIARVQGAAYGGGIGLMCVSDLVVASATARFALAEVRLGLIPATIGPYVIRRIGEGAARRLMLNGSTIDADLARALGLVSVIATEDGLDAAVEAEVGEFLKCAPGAAQDAKALCRHLAANSGLDHTIWTAERLADRWETKEAREGLDSFFMREPPPWAKGAR